MQRSVYLYQAAALVGLGLTFCAHPAPADALVSDRISGDSVRLSNEPCANPKVLRHLPAGATYSTAYAYLGGRQRTACWTLSPPSPQVQEIVVRLVLEDGRFLTVPASVFKNAPEA